MNIRLQMASAQITMAAMTLVSGAAGGGCALQQAGRNASLLNALLECGVNQSAKAPAGQSPRPVITA